MLAEAATHIANQKNGLGMVIRLYLFCHTP
jgi:hypothetical protein